MYLNRTDLSRMTDDLRQFLTAPDTARSAP